jgi:hypothetical protein
MPIVRRPTYHNPKEYVLAHCPTSRIRPGEAGTYVIECDSDLSSRCLGIRSSGIRCLGIGRDEDDAWMQAYQFVDSKFAL